VEFTQTYFETFLDQTVAFLPKLFLAIVIFLASLYLAKLAALAVDRTLKFRDTDPELTLPLVRLSRWAVIVFGLMVALQQVNFNVSSFIAGLGIVGFTLSFAFQDIAKNFISGVLLLLQQPFDIGDAIEVSGISGTVTDIELRSTTICTFDGKHVIIPNADVYTSTITNFTRSPKRRLQLEVGVGYESDLEQVATIIEKTLNDIEPIIHDDPAPMITFDAFADSSINLSIYFWINTKTVGFFDAQNMVMKAIKTAFEAENINIPFPVRTILMEK